MSGFRRTGIAAVHPTPVAARSWPPPSGRDAGRRTHRRRARAGAPRPRRGRRSAPAAMRAHRRAHVGRRVGVGADQRDLRERELAHVDLARPVLQSDVHDDAARRDARQRQCARAGRADRVDHDVDAGLARPRAGRGSKMPRRRARFRRRRAPQRIGFGEMDLAHAVDCEQERGEQADRAAAQHQRGHSGSGRCAAPGGSVDRVQRGRGRLGQRGVHRRHGLRQLDQASTSGSP